MHSQFSWGGVVPLPKVGFSIEDQSQTHWSLELLISPESKEQKKKKNDRIVSESEPEVLWLDSVCNWMVRKVSVLIEKVLIYCLANWLAYF